MSGAAASAPSKAPARAPSAKGPTFSAASLVSALVSPAALASEPAWLTEKRQAARKILDEGGMPTPRDEAWKYTNVNPITRRAFVPFAAPTLDSQTTEAIERARASQPHADCLVFINGQFSTDHSDADTPWSRMASLSETLASSLGTLVCETAGGFAALNMAGFTDGAHITVDRERSGRTVHLIQLVTGDDDQLALPRHAIVVENDCSATVLETYLSTGNGTHLCTSVVEAWLAPGANLVHTRIQNEAESDYHIAMVDVSVNEGATYTSNQLALGARISRCDTNVHLDAVDAHCVLNGLFVLGGRQHADLHTRVDHSHPNGTSDELIKGILDGHSRGVFNGQVYVHPDAQKTDSSQSNHNLLLSRDAEVDTKPQLEIYADDVKCSHGATVGQLDADMQFYLRSRGLSEEAARAMLTYAFAEEVLTKIDIDAARSEVLSRLSAFLPDTADLADASASSNSPSEA